MRSLELNMGQLRKLKIGQEYFFYSLSFDIDDFVGDGVWWLQVYDSNKRLIYDKPFASSRGYLDTSQIVGTINQEIYNV